METQEYIREISKLGSEMNIDAVLKLLEWCGKTGTIAVSLDEAREFYSIMLERPDSLRRLPAKSARD